MFARSRVAVAAPVNVVKREIKSESPDYLSSTTSHFAAPAFVAKEEDEDHSHTAPSPVIAAVAPVIDSYKEDVKPIIGSDDLARSVSPSTTPDEYTARTRHLADLFASPAVDEAREETVIVVVEEVELEKEERLSEDVDGHWTSTEKGKGRAETDEEDIVAAQMAADAALAAQLAAQEEVEQHAAALRAIAEMEAREAHSLENSTFVRDGARTLKPSSSTEFAYTFDIDQTVESGIFSHSVAAPAPLYATPTTVATTEAAMEIDQPIMARCETPVVAEIEIGSAVAIATSLVVVASPDVIMETDEPTPTIAHFVWPGIRTIGAAEMEIESTVAVVIAPVVAIAAAPVTATPRVAMEIVDPIIAQFAAPVVRETVESTVAVIPAPVAAPLVIAYAPVYDVLAIEGADHESDSDDDDESAGNYSFDTDSSALDSTPPSTAPTTPEKPKRFPMPSPYARREEDASLSDWEEEQQEEEIRATEREEAMERESWELKRQARLNDQRLAREALLAAKYVAPISPAKRRTRSTDDKDDIARSSSDLIVDGGDQAPRWIAKRPRFDFAAQEEGRRLRAEREKEEEQRAVQEAIEQQAQAAIDEAARAEQEEMQREYDEEKAADEEAEMMTRARDEVTAYVKEERRRVRDLNQARLREEARAQRKVEERAALEAQRQVELQIEAEQMRLAKAAARAAARREMQEKRRTADRVWRREPGADGKQGRLQRI